MSANVLNAFMSGQQFRNDQDDRRQRNALMMDDRRAQQANTNVNALMMGGQQQEAPRYEGQAETNLTGMDKARGAAIQSGNPDVMANFQQQFGAMQQQDRARAQELFNTVGQVANSLRGVPVAQRGAALRAAAPQLQALGAPDEEIQQYEQMLSDPNTSDAVLEALSARVLEAQGVFDAYAPQMQAENEVLSRFQNGQQVQGAVNPNATANRALEQRGLGISQQNADTSRMNAETARMEAQGQGGPDWVTLEPGDPRRQGFDEGEVVQYNTRTGQVARRSVDRVFNATESQAAGFAGRMNDAGTIIDQFETASDFEGVPELLWNRPTRLLPEQWQRYRQAGENWIRANLRRESGAVIGEDEMAAEFRVYFPQPGDSPEVIAQKARTRARAQQAMIAQSRGAYQEYGLDRPAPMGGPAQQATNEPSIDDLLNQYGD